MKTKGYKPKKEFTLKQKVIGTLSCLLLYRLLSFVPLPFVNSGYIQAAIGMNGSLGLLNVLSGGSLGNMSLMALGIGPWITASIVLQLIGMAFPKFADLNKEEDGKRTYKLITFGASALFALLEAVGLLRGYGRSGYLSEYTWYTVLIPALLMMVGTGILSLMGWYIDEKLFGNGSSLILTTGILCSYVSDGTTVGIVLSYGKGTAAGVILCMAALVVLFYLFFYTVFISSCEKRIPVVYAGKMGGSDNRKNMNTIPLKLLAGGVVPVIFASSIVTFPALLGSMFGWEAEWLKIFNTSYWLNVRYPWASVGFVLYIVLIIAFGYFCQLMYMNPMELAENLKKNGGTIPGVRPGRATADYITSQMKWLTALGGLFLCVVAAIPMIVSGAFGLGSLSFLGTSILIVVSTIRDTWDAWKTASFSKSYLVKGMTGRGIFG